MKRILLITLFTLVASLQLSAIDVYGSGGTIYAHTEDDFFYFDDNDGYDKAPDFMGSLATETPIEDAYWVLGLMGVAFIAFKKRQQKKMDAAA